MSKINVVLYEPEIPQNTGNIARLCACCGADLYLVGKLGFSLSDKYNEGDFVVFGPESRGLPKEYVTRDTAVTLPMKEGQRSLNLSNSVAITVYEVIRQNGI